MTFKPIIAKLKVILVTLLVTFKLTLGYSNDIPGYPCDIVGNPSSILDHLNYLEYY